MTKATNLTELSLSQTRLEGESLVFLAGLTKLELLDCTRTYIRDADLRHLAELRSLRDLTLDRTNVEGRGLQFLSKLSNLYHLRLYGTPLEDAQLNSLPVLPDLGELWVVQTGFADIGASRLQVACPKLRTIQLSDSFVTSVGIRRLLQLPNSPTIGLAGVKVTAEEAIELQEFFKDVVRPRDAEEIRKWRELKRRQVATLPQE